MIFLNQMGRRSYTRQKIVRDRNRAIDDVLEAPWTAGQNFCIPGEGAGRWILAPFMFGMLSEGLIPGKACPLTIELELVSDSLAILAENLRTDNSQRLLQYD